MINIFAAHPDDCEISMGCFLLKNKKLPMRVIYATTGDYLDGHRNPSVFLRDIPFEHLSYKDCSLTNTIELRQDLERIISPGDLNIVHWPDDTHKDHRELSQAVFDVCRGKNIIYYNSVSSQSFLGNLTFEYKESEMNRKVRRLQKAFSLDRPYLKREYFMRNLYNGVYTESLHVKNCSAAVLSKLFGTE